MSKVLITGTFSKDNVCTWLNFKAYYADGFRIVSENYVANGAVHYVVESPSKKALASAFHEANR